MQALNNGQVDCVVIDNAPAQEFVEANPGLTILETPYAEENYAIGVNKGNTQLLDALNGAHCGAAGRRHHPVHPG